MQDKLFYEDEYEALALMVSDSKRTFKEVAMHLFPHLKAESAYARFKACCDPEKPEKLTDAEKIAAMHFCESYHPLMYMCDATFHTRPIKKSPDEEEAILATVLRESASTMNKALLKLEQLQERKER